MIVEHFLRITRTDSKGKARQFGYVVKRLDPGVAKLIWALYLGRDDKNPRHVTVDEGGLVTCDCKNHDMGKKVCKHIVGLRQAGLLPGWRP